MLGRIASLVFSLIFACVILGPAKASNNVALVIGNSSYSNVPALENPANDAHDVSAALTRLGIESELVLDLGFAEMISKLREFGKRAIAADIAIIYYAGHGIEVDRNNYLIPTDARLETDRDIVYETVPLEFLTQAAGGAERLSLVLLDACRNNPFAAMIQRQDSSRTIGRGLSIIEPKGNTVIAYAAKAGTTAADGDGRNSPYASALLNALEEPRVEIGLMLRKVRDEVLEKTRGMQEPFYYGSLSANELYLNNAPAPKEIQVTEPKNIILAHDSQLEQTLWQTIANSKDPRDFQDFLSTFPDGIFASFAIRRLNGLRDDGVSPSVTIHENRNTRRDESQHELRPAAATKQLTPMTTLPLDRSEIREVQELLTILEFSPGGIDGISGKKTKTAAETYLRARGLLTEAGAMIDRELLARLRLEVSAATLAKFRSERAKLIAAQTAERKRQQMAAAAAAEALAVKDQANAQVKATERANSRRKSSSRSKTSTKPTTTSSSTPKACTSAWC